MIHISFARPLFSSTSAMVAPGRLATLTVCAASVLALGACSGKGADGAGAASAPAASATAQPAAGARPLMTVDLVRPATGAWSVDVAAHGVVAAWQEAMVGPEVGGLRLDAVLVNVGDRVRKGQVLATLRPDVLQADLQAARASLVEAQALWREAQSQAARARALLQADAMSNQEAQRALTAEETARARVDVLQAQVNAQALRLSQSRVLAPDDGVISARQATSGSVVQAGQELFRLIRQGRLEWRAEVAATQLHQMAVGQGVDVTGPSGQTVSARVRMVGPTVDPGTRNGLVYVDLPVQAAQAAGLRAGMFVPGHIRTGQSQGLTLPQTAVLLREGFSYVFLVGADGKVQEIKVRTGRRFEDRVEVLDKLPEGRGFVASGVGFLSDGDTVQVRQAKAGASS